jgi:major membrane immunogen (membrane-anchored lipoprotein)
MTGPLFLRRVGAIGSALCLIAGCLIVLGAAPASGASPTSYYVDNTAPCPGSGTETSPWCDFSVVNSTTLHAGDQLLLKSGDTFTSGLTVIGSGTSTSYLTVGAYGSGASPIISGGNNTSFVGIDLYNNSYVAVQNISVEDAESGILIDDTTNQTGYRFLNLSLSGDGIGLQSPGGTGIASNILVQDVTGVDNTLLCRQGTCGGGTLEMGDVSNVIVNRLYSYGNCAAAGWSLGQGATNVVVENSRLIGDGDCPSVVGGGTTANFIDQDTNVTYVNDVITDIPNDNGIDMSAIDVEPQDGPDSGINIEDNYIADNAGPGIEILDHPSPTGNLNITGNVLSDNADDYATYPYNIWGQIWTDEWLNNFVEATGSIDNNLYNAPANTGGFEVAHNSANLNGFSQSNNLDVSGQNNVWYAASGFSCAAQGANDWSYQTSSDNSTWTNLSGCTTVSTLDQEWTTGGTASGFVSNFEELAPSTPTSWIARSWTAPSAGTVSIRGRILMTDPTCNSGVTAEITESGSSTPIWGPQVISAGNGVGVDTNLDGVSVNAGGVLHFAVQENGSSQCRVSWTPSVAIPNPVTKVVLPSGGAELTGMQTLDATASDSASQISSVKFLLSGGSLNDTVIATGTKSNYGWYVNWQSATVPNGSYTLASEVTDVSGNTAYSPAVTINIDNPAPTTSILEPSSSGASVSGAQVVVDAAASSLAGVSSVQFYLAGGSLNNTLIATGAATSYGWATYWNSRTVPDGTYTLESKVTDAAGNTAYSPAVTINVDNPAPTTSILEPSSSGASESGTQVVLDAAATSAAGISKVQFHLTGGSLNNTLIATGAATYYGWAVYWNSTTVPDGTYTLESDAYDSVGNLGVSTAVTIVVDNPLPTTSILEPSSNGASVSGTQVVLDAAATGSSRISKVQFHLTGGSLNNAVIATGAATYYGWAADWNSTTVPDGTYTLVSEAYDAAGNQGVSAAVTIDVDNPPPTTAVLSPANGASVKGLVGLDASTSTNVGVTQVQFYLTGGSLNDALIGTGVQEYFGWTTTWNTQSVPDGTYMLQSVVDDSEGDQEVSSPVTVTVSN